MFFSLVLTFKTKSLSPNEKLKYSLLGIPEICKIESVSYTHLTLPTTERV